MQQTFAPTTPSPFTQIDVLNATAHPTPPSPALEVSAQGTCMDRTDASQQVWVGGESTTCINGEVLL